MLTKLQNYRPSQPVRSAAGVTAEQSLTSPPSSTHRSARDIVWHPMIIWAMCGC